jgi:hypothetical protein
MQTHDVIGVRGTIILERRGPDGELLELEVVHNLVTQVGDQLYGEKAWGLGALHIPTGMRLGTSATAPAKTGAGAAIVAYVAGTAKAFTSGPASALVGTARRITCAVQWIAGEADGAALREIVVTLENPITDQAGTAADTQARALFGPMTLGAADTLTATWLQDIEGQ